MCTNRTNGRFSASFRLLTLLLALAVPAGARAESTPLNWKEFSLSYGPELKLEEDKEAGEARNLSFESAKGSFFLLLTLIGKDFEAEKQVQELPAKASESFCLGLALKLAGEGRTQSLSESYGMLELKDGPAPTARFHIPAADGKLFASLECVFHVVGKRAFGAIISYRGKIGEVDHSAELHRGLREAYKLLRELEVRQPG